MSNWSRVQGQDRYAEAYEAAEAAAFGPRMVFLRNLSATTDGLINGAAAGALRRERLAQARGELTAPANVGQHHRVDGATLAVGTQHHGPERAVGLLAASDPVALGGANM